MLASIGIVIGFVGVWLFLLDHNNNFAPALLIVSIVLMVAQLFVEPAKARDIGQWENGDPAIRQWYQSLMQPDNPTVSCCGEADAYWCDEVYVRSVSGADDRAAHAFCRITDDRPDAPLGRPHVDIGTEIQIPDYKLKFDRGNPTGHAIVFLSTGRYVYCFVQNGGV